MSVNDVCRLCLAKENLVWIFDERFESCENMKDVIYITTGVQMEMKDIISQKICDKCCQVTIKMFEFRRTSLKNDNYLREQCKQYLQKNDVRIPNTEVTIKSDPKVSIKNGNSDTKETKPVHEKPVLKIHPTVRELFKAYPQIRLPTVCLKSHISPVVSMPMDGVENYFKSHNLDFHLYTKLALKSGKVATKRTSAPVKSKILSVTNSNSSENKDKSFIHQNYIKPNTENCLNKTVDIIKDGSVNAGVNQPCFKPSLINKDSVADTIVKSGTNVPSEKTLDKKRKFSEVENSSKKESVKKPYFAESLGLAPKVCTDSSSANTESPAYVANVSVPLHICDICNSVQYSAKDLRKHQNKHLRCQFCKTRFRTLESKNEHIQQKCIIKNTMNNLPDVVLRKIEYSRKIRKKYPDAFVNFAPLKGLSTKCNNSNTRSTNNNTNGSSTNKSSKSTKIRNTNDGVQKTLHSDKKTESAKRSEKSSADLPKSVNTGSIENQSDIIEILSDDEDTAPTTNVNKETSTPKSLLKNDLLNTKSSNKGENATSNNKDVKPSAQVTPEFKTPSLTPHFSNTTVPQENIVYNTVSIVKPDIKIKGNNILDTIDPKLSDIKLLKELLNSYISLTLLADKNSQTDLPTNDSVTVINHSDATTELKNLKQHMHVFKIPVVIKNGFFNVSYNYHTEEKQPKKLYLWNDLTPNDIKTKNKSIPNRVSNENQVGSITNLSNVNQVRRVPNLSNENQVRSVSNPSKENQIRSAQDPSHENQVKSIPNPSNENQMRSVPNPSNENQVRNIPNPSNENQIRSVPNPSNENQIMSVPNPSTENQVKSIPNPSNENQVRSVPNPSNENQVRVPPPSSENQIRSVPNPSNENQVWSVPNPSNENQVRSVPNPNNENQVRNIQHPSNENQGRSVANPNNENQVWSVPNPSNENQVRGVPNPSKENQVRSEPNPSNENEVWIIPTSSNENQLSEEINSTKNNGCSILPSTATYHSSGYYNAPAQTARIPQCTPVNNDSVNSLPNDDCAGSDFNMLSKDPLLNNCLQASNSSPCTGQSTTSMSTTSGSTNPVGTIRVKSVWELT